MKVRVPEFPTEVSSICELPDIGELLMYPHFHGISAERYRRYASDFQKKLLDCVPIEHARKNVLIRSGVWLLRPGVRSHVANTGDWHIDGVTDNDHIYPRERVHILSSPCTCLTEFNVFPLEIESSENETRRQFTARLRRNAGTLGVVGRSIEPCRIYTFENHLHRAVEPQRIEFRFFLRIRETDEPPFTTEPLKTVMLSDLVQNAQIGHIAYGDGALTICYPEQLQELHNWVAHD